MSEILQLTSDEAFLRRVAQALITRAQVEPGGTALQRAIRAAYNRALLSNIERADQQAQRFVIPVLADASVAAGFAASGEPGIAQADIETVVEAEVINSLQNLSDLTDPALAITLSKRQSVIEDIAGAFASYAVGLAGANNVPANTTSGAAIRAWLTANVADSRALVAAAARVAHLVLADDQMLRVLSVTGEDALSGTHLREAAARVLPAIAVLDAPTRRGT